MSDSSPTFQQATPPESEFGYGQLLLILRRRGLWFGATFATVLALAAVMVVFGKPTYKSTMQLLVEPNYENAPKTSDRENFQSDRQNEVDYATQLNLMRSDLFVQQAVARLKADHPNEYRTLDAEQVRKALTLAQLKERETGTKIFKIVYTDTDPVKTQRMLETLHSLYQAYNLEQQEIRLTRGVRFVDEQLERLRQGIGETQRKLEQFRQGQNLIDPEEQATAVTDALNKNQVEQQAVLTEYRDAEAAFAELQQQLALSPQEAIVAARLSQSTRFQSLLDEFQKTELALAKERTRYTDKAYTVQRLVDQRQGQLDLLRQEVQRVLPDGAPVAEETALLQAGQLGTTDLTTIKALVETQVKLTGLRAQIQSLMAVEQDLQKELSRFPSLIATYNRLKPGVEIERATFQRLLEERQKLGAELARGGFNWQMVEQPQLGEKQSPLPAQTLLLGAVVGLFLGGAVAFGREYLDGVMRSAEDVQKCARIPVLGTLPALTIRPMASVLPRGPLPMGAVQRVQSVPFRERLDWVFKNLQLRSPTLKSLVVTSALRGEGKSTVALGLALSAARLHQRVLVIDADLRSPSLHQSLGVSGTGLAQLLANPKLSPQPIAATLGDTRIDLLPAGPSPLDPVKLLGAPPMQALMAQLEQHYDLIVIDTPPLLGVVDAMQIASVCSGLVLVSRLDMITRPALTQALALASPLSVLGVVVNSAEAQTIAELEPRSPSSPQTHYQPAYGFQAPE
jgi:polysaccharide biosynthesis transport protein